MNVSGKPEGGSVAQEMKRPSGLPVRSEQLLRVAPLILLVLVLVVLGLFVPYFLTTRNIINILLQSSALGLMALGMTVVLIVGGIDLSMPAVMAFSSILGVMYMREKGNPIVAGLIIIVVAMAIGSVNGYAVARLRMIPFVVTLSMQAIVMGASLWVTQAISVTGINEGFVDTVLAKVWIIPVPIIVTLFGTIQMRNVWN